MYASLKKLKSKIEKRFKPLFLRIFRMGVRPAHLTFLSLVFGVLGAFYLFKHWMYAAACLLIWFLLDVGDGMLARVNNASTSFGGWSDFLVDRIVLVSILYRYYEFQPDAKWTVLAGLSIVLVFSVDEMLKK
jgi:archaetidylinositol phosphate synthase